MKYLAGWRGLSGRRQTIALIWSDGVIEWRSQRRSGIQLPLWPQLELFICSWLQTPGPENTIWGKKNYWLKNWPFFIIENFLGILNRLCTEPMRRSNDFLTMNVVGSTSGSCYFLPRCRCLSVCVLCVLVVMCVKS